MPRWAWPASPWSAAAATSWSGRQAADRRGLGSLDVRAAQGGRRPDHRYSGVRGRFPGSCQLSCRTADGEQFGAAMDRGTAGQSAGGPESARGRMADDMAAAPAVKPWSDVPAGPDPQSPLRIPFHREPATLQLAGVVDDSTYPVLTRSLARAALSGATAIRIDLTGVEFCDLAGLRAITSLANPAGQGPGTVRQVTIAHLPAQLTGIIRILG